MHRAADYEVAGPEEGGQNEQNDCGAPNTLEELNT
jgi:hypothetical protein